MKSIYTVGEFSKLIGKSVNTLQRWDREGILKAYRSPSKRRYYTHHQYLTYIGESDQSISKINVIYARVSSSSQKQDLSNQLDFLRNYTINHGIPIGNIYSDIGSGLNYKRKNWNNLLDDCFTGKIDTIYVSHKDRFVRFGFDWLADLLKRICSVNIVVLNDITTSPESELVSDLISIIHVFSCRVYGLRKYKKKLENDYEKSM